MDFPEMLTRWMAVKQLNGADAAAQLNVSASTITRWLKGTGVPSVKRVEELAETFGLPSVDVALAIVQGAGKTDPLERAEMLVTALASRLEAVEVRQQALEAELAELRRRKR